MEPTELVKDQVEMIRRHLGMVFIHEIDPSYSDQAALAAAHQETEPVHQDDAAAAAAQAPPTLSEAEQMLQSAGRPPRPPFYRPPGARC
jgi:hypothetical protein